MMMVLDIILLCDIVKITILTSISHLTLIVDNSYYVDLGLIFDI